MIKFMIHIIFAILLLCSLVFNTFILKNYDSTFTLIALIIFLGITLLLRRERKSRSRNVVDTVIIIGIMAIFVLGGFYLAGFSTKFINNYNSLFKNYIEDAIWIRAFLITGIAEVIRYLSIPRDDKYKVRNTIYNILLIAILVMVDINICTKIYNLTKLSQLYEFISLIVVQSISKNIFLNYLSKNYGLVPCLWYRLLLDLYIYLVPATPKINVFIEGVIMLVFPYVVFMILQIVYERKSKAPARREKKENKIVTLVGAVIFAILVALVSREFEYCMIAIGSGSMTGSINKGDAVIYKTYNKEEDELEAGDVLVFYKKNKIIVHRIVKKYTIYGKEVYQTKGDANKSADNWVVEEDEVIGVVNQRIPLIAWPSVTLNALFNS